MGKNWLQTPEWSWTVPNDKCEFVHHWVRPLKEGDSPDMVLYGAPISRSSISVSGASLYPLEFRRLWKNFTTYNLDENIDLAPFHVADAGDITMHTTDILLSHQRIQEATAHLADKFPDAVTCLVGGDHSVTACAVRGIKEVHTHEEIGIMQIDTHLDVRDPQDLGPANGTPIRQLIDGKVVKGENVVNIGLHGYFNAKQLVDYAREHQIKMVPLNKARKRGLAQTVQAALDHLSKITDRIYVTVDMDVLDISVAPGVPASTPGGMTSVELFDILLEIGKRSSVRHIDFVCLDPSRDSTVSQTVKTGVYAWLQFITGQFLKEKAQQIREL